LKGVVNSEGVWRIRRQERGKVLECFKIEEVGHGSILSEEFINWRIKLGLPKEGNGEGQEGQEA
jgi:RAT1-interacting protein